ncbi:MULTISPECIES: 4-hydroxy-2-oxovalerate aldolase [unclassified Moorena]|uniref:4-hydroxy-2-oxovalerate aldolase n=2 Tax=Moorena TaxID=1155738 RepID=UPI0013FF3CDA|nr:MULTISPECIES: 4-hydroxy-2-oxovalerate aldolase [unclassified Moorena]NEO12167.1 4-hydroxy-2-oxovalerate aldolase [Moorena sp. SIO3E8]NEQ00919.1 4-hydroxy-2-oxovalerate aldolase [Moorena sp. SIO3F7]
MMTSKRSVNLVDCTLRDGSYATNFQFSARDTRKICQHLEAAGIKMIEVGHGLGLGASSLRYGVAFESDEDYLKAATTALHKAQFGAFFIPGIGSADHIRQAQALGMDFIRIGNDVGNIGKAQPFVALAKDLGMQVSLNFMKSYAVSPEEFGPIINSVQTWGMDMLYVVDSAGCMLPNQVAEYIRVVRDCSDVAVGFHGHNNLDLANANCLAAVDAGATYVDGTLLGMGRSAGNAQTEVLAYLLNQAGYECPVDPFVLFEAAARYIEPLMPYPQGLPSMDVVIGMSKFHSGHLPRFKRVLSHYDVDIRRLVMVVSQIDCVNPSDELIETVAKDLSRIDEYSSRDRRAS